MEVLPGPRCAPGAGCSGRSAAAPGHPPHGPRHAGHGWLPGQAARASLAGQRRAVGALAQQQQQQQAPRKQARPSDRPARPPSGSAGKGSADEPLLNAAIRFPTVRVLDSSKEMLGVMSTAEARDRAAELGVDLILLNPDADPPLTRLVELSKYRYELAKADKNQRKKQRENRQDLKELKFRPNTDIHDYNVRLRNAKKFLSKGDKVKLTMQFKGREMEFKGLGKEMFQRFIKDLGDEATVAQDIAMAGYSMTLILSPVKK